VLSQQVADVRQRGVTTVPASLADYYSGATLIDDQTRESIRATAGAIGLPDARPYPNLSRAARKPFSAMRSFSNPARRVRLAGLPSPFRAGKLPISMPPHPVPSMGMSRLPPREFRVPDRLAGSM